MNTKEKNKGNQDIKRIRKELGITQGQLAFSGMARSTIASWENGERVINHKQAARLAAHLQEMFGYQVSAKVIMGQDKDIAEILKPIQKGTITEAKLIGLDNIISNENNDRAVEIILSIIEILKVNADMYAKYMLKYILKLNEFKLEKNDYIQVNLDLMMVYEILNDFNSVLIASSAIKIYIDEFSKHDKLRYFFNLSNAYYKLKKYIKAREYLKKAKKFAEPKYTLNILSLESNILISEKKFNEVIAINKKIIVEAKILKIENYIANSKSNIAYILIRQKKLDEAGQYIREAMTYINNIDNLNKLNILNNKFYFELNTNSAMLSSFKLLILLSIKLDNEIRINENIELFIKYSIRNNKTINEFLEIFDFLKVNNISVDANLKLEVVQHIYKNHHDCDFAKFLTKIMIY